MTHTDPRAALEDASFLTADAPRSAAVRFSTAATLDRPRSEVASAVLVATAHGVYEATVDGEPASTSVLDPGWTSYEWRLNVQRHDVTGIIRGGEGDVRID